MSLETRPFDPAAYLDTVDGMAAYLDEAFATNDPAFVADAFRVVARAADVEALELGPSRKAALEAVMKALAAVGLRLTVCSTRDGLAVEGYEAESSLG
jgi:hypothetical protein